MGISFFLLRLRGGGSEAAKPPPKSIWPRARKAHYLQDLRGGRLMSDSACGSKVLHHYSFPFFRAQRGKTETGKIKYRSAEGERRRPRKAHYLGT
jgi:hypothetical protein